MHNTKEEMKNMRKNFRKGSIVDLKAGGDFNIDSITLYPLSMKLWDEPYGAYMLLWCNGSFRDADYTPYFFKSKTTRDEVLE